MEDPKSLTFRLESYLMQLADIHRRWAEWLSANERAVMQLDLQGLGTLQTAAEGLQQELRQVVADRSRLLQDAAESGLPARDLHALARRLPAWQKASLRSAMTAAQVQLEHLKRLHVATWVLIYQAFQLVSGNLQLLKAGCAGRAVYTSQPHADTEGGQLLDTDL